MLLKLTQLFLLFHVFNCVPDEFENDNNHDKDLLQGDIMLTPAEEAEIFGKRTKRQLKSINRWPDATVYYQIDKTDSTWIDLYSLQKAFEYISDRSCVKFMEKNATNHLLIDFVSGCQSYVGMIGGVQRLKLGPNCQFLGVKVHEILHALGCHHTMSRYDRDEYLNVDREAMGERYYQTNFYLLTPYNSYNVIPYEYLSVLHYQSGTDSYPKDPEYALAMGNRLVKFYDIKAINTHYSCSCPIELDCKNGGYTNPAKCSECLCPDGFGGVLCNEAPKKFSKKLLAETEWKEHKLGFGFNSLYDHHFIGTASLFIEAPPNKTIQVQVTTMDGFFCASRCHWSAFEVKHMGDPRHTNPLYCCKDKQNWNQTFTSKLNPTVVNLYNRYMRVYLGVKYCYINASLADLPRTNNTYDSFEYPL